MHTVQDTTPVTFGETVINKITVAPLMFVQYAELMTAAMATAKPRQSLSRTRILKQTQFTDTKGEVYTPTVAELLTMPVTVAKEIRDHLDDGQGVAGKILSEGTDGITGPVLYQLGKPIELKVSGKDVSVVELEIHAKTYKDVEAILDSSNDAERTVEILSNISAPVAHGSQKGLPHMLTGHMLDQITMADGFTLMNAITGNF